MTVVNRFVRFGYRRPPPWSSISSSTSPSPPSTCHELSGTNQKGWNSLNTEPIPLEPINITQQATIPSVAHGIDIVLKGDGLYPLEAPWLWPRHRRAPRLFSDSLRRIVQPDYIAWDAIPSYIPASRDTTLHQLAGRTQGISFCSSTSSVTPILSSLYHVISNFRNTGLYGGLSTHVRDMPASFSRMHRRPVAIMVEHASGWHGDDHVYSVNAHHGEDFGPSILRDLGHSMERMLTTSPTEFAQRYVLSRNDANDFTQKPKPKQSSNKKYLYHTVTQPRKSISVDSISPPSPTIHEDQFYHYSRASQTLLRAQIDCVNAKTGELFDVKTRAVAPIRYDLANYGAFTTHRLRFLQGRIDSYEREFYDMVRSVFLKYALQLRIGRMSGALVAYHNTTEVLGLEYIRLEEIESYVFGNTRWADIAFATSLRLFELIVNTVTQSLTPALEKNEAVKIVLYNEWSNPRFLVFAQRVQIDGHDPFGAQQFTQQVRDQGLYVHQKVREGEEIEENVDSDTNENDIEKFLGHELYHFDSSSSLSSIRNNEQQQTQTNIHGVATIGSHPKIRQMGARTVDNSTNCAPVRKRPWTARFSQDFQDYNFDSLLSKNALRVWELNVAPVVNGMSPKRGTGVNVEDDDDFDLNFKLTEIDNIKEDHLSKFVLALGSVYIR